MRTHPHGVGKPEPLKPYRERRFSRFLNVGASRRWCPLLRQSHVVANMDKSEDTLDMRGCRLRSLLTLLPIAYRGPRGHRTQMNRLPWHTVHPVARHGIAVERTQSLVLIWSSLFLARGSWANQLIDKDVKRGATAG